MEHPDQSDNQGLQLSLRYGEVWAHWPRLNSNVNLGRADAVCAEMSRFLAAVDYGERRG